MMARFIVVVVLAMLAVASSFTMTAPRLNLRQSTSLSMALDRVILKPLPRVYIYGHCPFCVRVRLAFGLKNIKHDIYFMANDDVDTPTALIGKKVAPIYEFKPQGVVMGESFDIIAKVDSDETFGPTNFFKPISGRTDILAWQKKVKPITSILSRPRYMMVVIPEFSQKDGRDAFVKNHEIPPYEKKAWKSGDMSLDQKWALYNEAYIVSKGMIKTMNDHLVELDDMLFSSDYCTEGGLSYDDIDLFSRMRSLTLVAGIVLPEKLGNYLQNLSEQGDVPLYNCMAV